MHTVRRTSVIAVATVAVGMFIAAACAPMAPPGGGAAWPGPGCLDGDGNDGATAPDLRFSGTPNVRGNAVVSVSFVGGEFVPSADGTCSGLPVAATTIVRAPDAATAAATCAALGAGTVATSYTGSPWTLPADAWACTETYFL
jgi:hypothetical protein